MTRTYVAAVVAGGMLIGAQMAVAQTPAGQQPEQDRARSSSQAEGRRASGDVQNFIRRAAESGMKEAEAGWQAQSQATSDPVKAFAEKTLPTLREHLEMARSIQQQLGKGGQ